MFVGWGGDKYHTLTSANGVDWELRPTPSGKRWNDCCWGDAGFVAVAGDGTVMICDDGLSWSLHETPAPGVSWWRISYVNGMYIAVGQKEESPLWRV